MNLKQRLNDFLGEAKNESSEIFFIIKILIAMLSIVELARLIVSCIFEMIRLKWLNFSLEHPKASYIITTYVECAIYHMIAYVLAMGISLILKNLGIITEDIQGINLMAILFIWMPKTIIIVSYEIAAFVYRKVYKNKIAIPPLSHVFVISIIVSIICLTIFFLVVM